MSLQLNLSSDDLAIIERACASNGYTAQQALDELLGEWIGDVERILKIHEEARAFQRQIA